MGSANHGGRTLTDPEAHVPIIKSRMDDKSFKEIAENQTLKPLSRDFLKQMLTTFFQKVPNDKLGASSSVFNNAGSNTAIVICKDKAEAETALNKLNLEIITFMNDYIEEETGESCKNYFRTYTLFESKIEENRLILTWQ